MLNCQALTTYIQKIKVDKNRLDNFIEGRKTDEAKKLQAELQPMIKKLRIIIGLKDVELLPDQIALSEVELSHDKKLYNGPLFAGIFQNYPNLEYIYTSFPEGRVFRNNFKTSGKKGKELAAELKKSGVDVQHTERMLNSTKFIVNSPREIISTIRLKVNDLFSDGLKHSFDEILVQATKFGLSKLPHEVGSDLLLNEETQPKLGEWFSTVMEPIADVLGRPVVFSLGRRDDGLRLTQNWADPDRMWDFDDGLVFRICSSIPTINPAQLEEAQ